MLNLQEIDEAIAEIESGKTTYSACAKLADLYAVREHIMRQMQDTQEYDEQPKTTTYTRGYSRAPGPIATVDSVGTVDSYGDSEFLLAIVGKAPASAWRIIDELMDALKMIQPRLYDSVMRRLDLSD